jgi:hypothetical protein
MVNPTEATTAMLSRMAVVIAVTYRLSSSSLKSGGNVEQMEYQSWCAA